MKACIVDASVVVKWFLPEPHSEAAARLRRPDLELHAPELLLLEVASALWKHSIRGALEPATAHDAVEALPTAPIRWHGLQSSFAEAFRLATETKRSVYDCSYLALSLRLQQPVVTADRRFYDAIQPGTYGSRLIWIEDFLLSPTAPSATRSRS